MGMTAKEEAQRLVDIFRPYANGYQTAQVWGDVEVNYSSNAEKQNAKQCAIACIYEMIKRFNEICYNHGLNERHELEDEFNWLERIKQEIKAL
jgi:hypothetical protein